MAFDSKDGAGPAARVSDEGLRGLVKIVGACLREMTPEQRNRVNATMAGSVFTQPDDDTDTDTMERPQAQDSRRPRWPTESDRRSFEAIFPGASRIETSPY